MEEHKLKHPRLLHDELIYDHLCGKEFIEGVQDCYTIPMRMFKDNLGIELTNYARPTDWWTIDGFDLYKKYFTKEGFSVVEITPSNPLRVLDCILMSIPDERAKGKNVTNHCAVYIGNGKVIHHRPNALSQVLPYSHYLKDFTTMVLRHRNVPVIHDTGTTKKLDLMDYILPSKKERYLGALNERNS